MLISLLVTDFLKPVHFQTFTMHKSARVHLSRSEFRKFVVYVILSMTNVVQNEYKQKAKPNVAVYIPQTDY